MLGHPIANARRLARSRAARRLAAAAVALTGGRLGGSAGARGREFLVANVIRGPVAFTDRFGVRYLLYPSDALYETFLNQGSYERAEQEFCARYVQPGMTVLDVGANHGVYTLLFAKLAAPANVHAFEPEQWNFERLRVNVALNGFDNVVANRRAVFSEPGEVTLNVFPPEQHGWHTLGSPRMEVDGQPRPPVTQQTVAAVTLDGYAAERGLEQIDLLKLDVEGAELGVLRGASRLLAEGRIRCMLFEISRSMVEGMGHRPEEVLQFVRDSGFAVHQLDEAGKLSDAPARPERDFQNFVALA
jgi:FkbM family methyltransferase